MLLFWSIPEMYLMINITVSTFTCCAEWHANLTNRITSHIPTSTLKIHSGFSPIRITFLCPSTALLFVAHSCSSIMELVLTVLKICRPWLNLALRNDHFETKTRKTPEKFLIYQTNKTRKIIFLIFKCYIRHLLKKNFKHWWITATGQTGLVPSQWKMAKIIPTHKSGTKDNIAN